MNTPETKTPETDHAEIIQTFTNLPQCRTGRVAVEFARQLETERNEARKQRDELIEALQMLLPQEPNDCDSYDRAQWKYAKQAIANVKGETE